MPEQLAEIYPYHLEEFVHLEGNPKLKLKKIDIVATKWLDYSESRKISKTVQFRKRLDIIYCIIIKERAKTLSEAHKKLEELNEKECTLTLDSSDDDFYMAEKKLRIL